MGDLMAVAPGKLFIDVGPASAGSSRSSSRKSHSMDLRVESAAPCGKGAFRVGAKTPNPRAGDLNVLSFGSGSSSTAWRRKSLVLATPAFLGSQLPAHPLAVRYFVPLGLRTSSKNQLVSLGAPVVAFFDPELHTVLELASDAELLDVSNILYGKSLLSPLLKSFAPGDGSVGDHDGQLPKNQADRHALMVRLESRFLFLAADAKAVLSGRRPSYRSVLLQVRKKLQIPCSADLSTEDIESEIFLHLLQQYSRKPTATAQPSLAALRPSSAGAKNTRRYVGLPSIMKLRGKELLSVVLKGGGAVTISTLQRFVFKKLSGKLLVETARYQLAKEAVIKTGQLAAMLETRVAVLAARQGLVGAAKRFVAVRSAMSILGPMLWGTLLADLLISAVGTDYARVVRAIYAFAQIRLVRAYSWDDTNQL